MRHRFIIAGLVAAMAAPSLALAQPDPSCVRSNNQTSATGTVLGALGGALIGSAIAGRHNRGVGVVGGAVAGGVAGNVLAGQHNDPCPDGYYRPAPPPPPQYGPQYGPQGAGFWEGAPPNIHQRIDFLYNRIGQAHSNGWLGRHDTDHAFRDLNGIREQEGQMRYRDGGHLSPPDRDYLQSRLDDLSRRINWQTHGG
jgi:hypothetical protein